MAGLRKQSHTVDPFGLAARYASRHVQSTNVAHRYSIVITDFKTGKRQSHPRLFYTLSPRDKTGERALNSNGATDN